MHVELLVLPASVLGRVVVALMLGVPLVALILGAFSLRPRPASRESSAPSGGWLVALLAAVQLGAFAVAVAQLAGAREPSLDSAFAKVDVSMWAQVEWIVVLGGWGPLALAAGYAALLLLWAAHARSVGLVRAKDAEATRMTADDPREAGADDGLARAWRAQPGPSAPWLALSAVACGVGLLQVRRACVDFLQLPPHQRMAADLERHFERTRDGLEQSVWFLFAALVIAGAALVIATLVAAQKRKRVSGKELPWAPSIRACVLFVSLSAAVVVGLALRTRPLVLESEFPIPMTHTFANASLGFLPELGISGAGPDDLPEGPQIVIGVDSATVDGTPTAEPAELATVLKQKRELFVQIQAAQRQRQGLDPNGPSLEHALVTVAPGANAARLRSYLAAVHRGGFRSVTFTLSEVQTLHRPVLGKLVGARFTGLKVALVKDVGQCPDQADAREDPSAEARRNRSSAPSQDAERAHAVPPILTGLFVKARKPPCHVVQAADDD